MLNSNWVGIVPVAAMAFASPAGAACPVPNQISNGQVSDATPLMGNFTALGNCAVSTTGSPAAGGLPVFSGASSVGPGNLTGDVTTSGSTATSLSSTGVTAGSYTGANITVDTKGRVTAAWNGNAVTKTGSPVAGNLSVFSGANSVGPGNLTGDVTTSGSTATSLAPSGVTPGSYANPNITVDAKGRVTAASSGAGSAFSGGLVKLSAHTPNLDFSNRVALGFNYTTYDTANYHSETVNNTRLTVPTAGYYEVGAQLVIMPDTLALGDTTRISIDRFNSAGVRISRIGTPQALATELDTSAGMSIGLLARSWAIYCDAGDYLEVFLDTESDTNITI